MAIDLYKNRCSVYDEGEKPYIFISYSHKDIEKVVSLIRKLQSLGFRIWYDSGVPAGAEWPEEIATHLKNSGCILSLLSANAAKSRHFKEEFNYAYHLQKPILVAYLEDCELTPGIEMRVVSQQCIKCEHCEDDDDLLEEIARAKILLPCLGEKPDTKPDFRRPIPSASLSPLSDNPNPEFDELLVKAEKGDAQAQYDIGLSYYKGNGVEQNYAEAIKWYRKAAKQGYVHAQVDLGFAFESGNGVKQNYEEAVKWYRKAVEQGDSYAQYNLGVCYENGKGLKKDMSEAVHLYQLAANQGDPDAQNNLAVCYETGNGVPMDILKALELYHQSAVQDHPLACWNLGCCYQNGTGVPQDWENAVYWFRKAADFGDADAQKKMESCYRLGLGVPIDLEEAARWQKLYDENPDK